MTDRTRVSIIMANHQGARHLPAAIASVRRQTLTDWELIVSDDGSTDDSAGIVAQAAAGDPRIRLIRGGHSAGPGAARNRAFAQARGDWLAIVDSDDLLHPDRLARMVRAAEAAGADMIADDMVLFGEGAGTGGRTLLQPLDLCAPLPVTTGLYIRASSTAARLPALGYLKPLIRRAVLGHHRYDESLRVGEDYDLCLRLLLSGARYIALADPMYLYRRHPASVSHRLSVGLVQAMIAAHDRLPLPALTADQTALRQRRQGLIALRDYEHLVAALKQRRVARCAVLLARQPGLLRPLYASLRERAGRTRSASVPRSALALTLGAGPAADRAGFVAVLAPPAPGQSWAAPPAAFAARLSDLWACHALTLRCDDAAGEWARWLCPSVQDGA